MSSYRGAKRQRGVALAVALIFLLVVTVISVIAASNSSLGLKMSSNMQDSYSSFQSAEAGIIAALSLAGTAADPFDGGDTLAPFSALDPNTTHPLSDLQDGSASVDVDIFVTAVETTCPRREIAYSADLLQCDYYRVESEHDVAAKARSKVNLGVVKTVIGSTGR